MAKFEPKYEITNSIANNLIQIERVKEGIKNLPINPKLLTSLRETAKMTTIHYSTQIEGNRLSLEEVYNVLKNPNKVISNTGRIRDEKEIKGYYIALDYIEKLIKEKATITEKHIKQIHALVEGGGNKKVKPTEYREGQNIITDFWSGNIVYMPPEAKDIPLLMKEFVNWINTTKDIPVPIKTAIIHYQFVTIHPYFDGNGRTARLLSGYIMDLNGYGFNGIGSLEEYFAYDIDEYYESIQMGLPALYYSGRENPPHPGIWIHYFLRMVKLYSGKICDLQLASEEEDIAGSLSFLKGREKELLQFLIKNYRGEFTPIEVSRELSVTNKTIINRLAVLVKNGFAVPILVNERIRSYELSEFTRDHEKEIMKIIS